MSMKFSDFTLKNMSEKDMDQFHTIRKKMKFTDSPNGHRQTLRRLIYDWEDKSWKSD